jgi:hypothetical protein
MLPDLSQRFISGCVQCPAAPSHTCHTLQVDALEFYTELLPQQLVELQALQTQAMRQLPRPAAFVTFK